MVIAERLYTSSKVLPKEEQYGLVSQIRRAAVSVPANVSEGYGRNNRGEYVHFLGIAKGSNCELTTLLLLAERVFPDAAFEWERDNVIRVEKMLTKLILALRPK